MWLQNTDSLSRRAGGNGLVAVGIDNNKNSQFALKWVVDNMVTRGQCIILIYVVPKSSSSSSYSSSSSNDVCDANGVVSGHKHPLESKTRQLFLTFHVYCTRKEIQCFDVVLEDSDVGKALNEYVSRTAIENLVIGASRHGFIRRLKTYDIPNSVMKGAPDFCTVYVISKAKISSVRNASRPAPFVSPLSGHIQQMQDQVSSAGSSPTTARSGQSSVSKNSLPKKSNAQDDLDMFRSPLTRGRGYDGRVGGDQYESDVDISFVSSSGRPSVDTMSPMFSDNIDSGRTSRLSTSSQCCTDVSSSGFSSTSLENEDVAAEMKRLKLELQKTMELYSTACKEALSAKQKEAELHRWRIEEEQRTEEAKLSEEGALALLEKEKAKCKAAVENAKAAQRKADLEAEKRRNVEKKVRIDDEENDNEMPSLNFLRYRRYSIEEIEEATENFAESLKIGEGGYGPVYKCYLDHTPVAVKVLRPDASQGRSQFHQEVEVLTCMRHPNLVLLLGACSEYGCLVYEYMANGNLEERLLQRGGTPPLSWKHRFRIAAEIATGLNFLHQTKPEPLVHRDLKPANILLDYNLVSKISDVGLARLVPPSVADDVTQFRMTAAAGTFCYIDPEYQQTGMLGVKSDVYSLGVVLLQLLTGKKAMGLTHYVGDAIENGTLSELLDPNVPDWPVEETLSLAKLAIQCAELRRKDRPDVDKVVIPHLNKLREFADECLGILPFGGSAGPSPNPSNASMTHLQEADNPINQTDSTAPKEHLPTETDGD